MNASGYLREVLPEGEKKSLYRKKSFAGLDRRRVYDSGSLSDGRNVDTACLPAVSSAPLPAVAFSGRRSVLGLFAGEGALLLVYRSGFDLCATLYQNGRMKHAVLKADAGDDRERRSIVAFRSYTTPLDPLSGRYERRLLVFPDKVWCPLDGESFAFSPIAEEMPDLRRAVVRDSRVIGVDGDRIYVSAFNDASDWRLDTAEDISPYHAWATTSQSDSRAGGGFTAVSLCDGAPVFFRRDYMQQLYGTKNPFRISDVGAWGCLSGEAACPWKNALAFASDQGVWLYTGGYPRRISDPLGVSDWSGTLLAASAERLYVYVPAEDRIFVYEDTADAWGERTLSGVSALASDGQDVYAATSGGLIYRLDRGEYGSFSFTCEALSLGTAEMRRIKGIAVTAELGEGAELEVALTAGGRTVTLCRGTEPGISVLRTVPDLRADELTRLSFSGTGKVTVYGATFSYSTANEPGGV